MARVIRGWCCGLAVLVGIGWGHAAAATPSNDELYALVTALQLRVGALEEQARHNKSELAKARSEVTTLRAALERTPSRAFARQQEPSTTEVSLSGSRGASPPAGTMAAAITPTSWAGWFAGGAIGGAIPDAKWTESSESRSIGANGPPSSLSDNVNNMLSGAKTRSNLYGFATLTRRALPMLRHIRRLPAARPGRQVALT